MIWDLQTLLQERIIYKRVLAPDFERCIISRLEQYETLERIIRAFPSLCSHVCSSTRPSTLSYKAWQLSIMMRERIWQLASPDRMEDLHSSDLSKPSCKLHVGFETVKLALQPIWSGCWRVFADGEAQPVATATLGGFGSLHRKPPGTDLLSYERRWDSRYQNQDCCRAFA